MAEARQTRGVLTCSMECETCFEPAAAGHRDWVHHRESAWVEGSRECDQGLQARGVLGSGWIAEGHMPAEDSSHCTDLGPVEP
jgi:hypothetical protein